MTSFSKELLTLNTAYPSCHENHFRFEKVSRIHRDELALSAFTNSAIETVEGMEM